MKKKREREIESKVPLLGLAGCTMIIKIRNDVGKKMKSNIEKKGKIINRSFTISYKRQRVFESPLMHYYGCTLLNLSKRELAMTDTILRYYLLSCRRCK